MAILKPFQLLEINVISAQDLEIVSKKMRTYVTAGVHPTRKLISSVDTEGHNNPTWNDKFVFKVDDQFLRQDTSAVIIEIYAENWIRHTIVGSVNVLVGNLIPPRTKPHRRNSNSGMRFVALQVRRPSGRPHGILNIGVALLDSSMRSMPLYSQVSGSAVGYRDLMDDNHLQNHHNQDRINDDNKNNNKKKISPPPVLKPILRRTKSERERVTFEKNTSRDDRKRALPIRESSILSISNVGNPFMKKTTKASSVISGAELREKPEQKTGRKGKPGSVMSDSVVSKESKASKHFSYEKIKPKEKEVNHVEKKEVPARGRVVEKKFTKNKPPTKATGKSAQKLIPYDSGAPKANQKYVHGAPTKPPGSVYTDSEVGPSPSEVAAALVEKRYPLEDGKSSVLDGWSLDESVEGLRSKLDRWRTELPPIYDRGLSSSYQSSVQRPRRHSVGGSRNRSFSCFGSFFGYECQCVCGGHPPGKKKPSRHRQSPSFL